MKRHNDEHIQRVFQKVFGSSTKLGVKRMQYLLRSRWSEVMGQAVAEMTESIVLRERTVIIKINSSVLRNEFHQNQTTLIKKINEILQEENFVDRIVLK